jgi:hypothetical protein
MSPAQRSLQRRLAFLTDYARGSVGPEILAVVVQKWDAPDYFETLLSLLRSSSQEKIKCWAGNFTKVRVFSGHLGTSNIVKHGAVLGDGVGLVLMPETRLAALSAALPPLRTRDGSAEQLRDFSLLGTARRRTLARLQINVKNRRLEQFIVDATHVLSESYLFNERSVTSGIAFEHVQYAPEFDDGIYHRVIFNEQSQGSLICQGRLLMREASPASTVAKGVVHASQSP